MIRLKTRFDPICQCDRPVEAFFFRTVHTVKWKIGSLNRPPGADRIPPYRPKAANCSPGQAYSGEIRAVGGVGKVLGLQAEAALWLAVATALAKRVRFKTDEGDIPQETVGANTAALQVVSAFVWRQRVTSTAR